MQITSLVLTVLAAAVLQQSLVLAADDPTVSLPGVIDLTPDNFNQQVNGNKAALVEFYAPWCGHCKRMVEDYKKLAAKIAADPKLSSRVVIGKVNADTHRELGERFGVQGFPTLKWFARGKAADKENAAPYEKPRTADQMFDFIQEQVEADRSYGRVEELDALARRFVKEGASGFDAILKEATAKLEALEGEAKANGEVYVALMKKAVVKGADYLVSERARLERMMGSGGVAAAKLAEMARKSSVLGAFAEEQE